MRISQVSSVLTLLPIASLAASRSPAASPPDCKCIPDDPCWPSEAEFQALNQSVAGNLLRGVPPGSVCYSDQPNYDEAECQYVRENWLVSTFHARDPISIGWPQWAGNPCPPIYPNGTSVNGDTEAGAKGCHIGGYPVYALNATNATYVQEVVRFAKDNNIRLNVKSTGHSFTGRSTAFGSISIWTHHLQGIDFHDNFQPVSCPENETQIAFSIGAGARIRDVYEAANDYNAIVVGGSAQDVGIVGWFTGGGHGLLSSTYGMGADNVLQVTVVTPQGDLVTANQCSHPDLFWAIRGGGGSTFGVITEVVMKAYPAPTMESQSFIIQPADSQNMTAFWDSAAYFWSELPRLKDGGLSGYSWIICPPFSPAENCSLLGSFGLFNKPNGTAEALFEPIRQHFIPLGDSINYSATTLYFPSFFSAWNSTIGYEAVGAGGVVLGSRLLDGHALTRDVPHLSSTLQNLSTVSPLIHAYMVANSDNRNLNVSLNPAWRDAVLHTIVMGGFFDNATLQEQQQIYNQMTYEVAPQLKSLAPDSGAYFNEGDPNDPNWQYTFFGENYPRLRSVKKQYDPDSVLWCRSCVNSEEWQLQSMYGEEWEQGRLCRAVK